MSGQSEQGLAADPAPFVPAQSVPAHPSTSNGHEPSGATAAGSLLAGRYRLGSRVGSDAAAGLPRRARRSERLSGDDSCASVCGETQRECRAHSGRALRRDVAATVLRRFGPGGGPDDDGGAARAEEIIAKALRSGSFEHPGCARLLVGLLPAFALSSGFST